MSSHQQDLPRVLPKIHLLCMFKENSASFLDAAYIHFPTLLKETTIQVHNCALKYLPPETRFDAIVSPANSYARLDGAFDDAIARAFGPQTEYGWITRIAQKVVYKQWRGFAPPGTCTVVPLLDDDVKAEGAQDAQSNAWGARHLLLCPTMRIPQSVKWDREVVYECVWSLLCAVDNHNETAAEGDRIESILMTPLATGVGRVKSTRWAEQCVLAMKHYSEAVRKPDVWGTLTWDKIFEDHEEVLHTYSADIMGPVGDGTRLA